MTETGQGMVKAEDYFESVEEIEEIMRNIAAAVHREINEMNPILDARLRDGSRVNAVYKNIALDGPAITIRKFSKEHITLDQIIRTGGMTVECGEALQVLVTAGYNIFISGFHAIIRQQFRTGRLSRCCSGLDPYTC